MRKLLLILCCIAGLTGAAEADAQQTTTIVEANSHSIFTGLFRSVWARLKALNPAPKDSAKSEAHYTAGIRGAESTDTLLKPYWKNDLTQDGEFQTELQKFTTAQLKMDQGELEAAVELFDGFLADYAQSDLRPNALFGKSISLAGLGRNEQSLSVMRQFVEENPGHPLVDDAKQVIDALK